MGIWNWNIVLFGLKSYSYFYNNFFQFNNEKKQGLNVMKKYKIQIGLVLKL